MRGGLRGFYVFIACIALGVMAIAGVGSVAASLGEGLAREGRTLLGGDVAFSLIQREAKPDEVAFLRSRGEVSVAATLRGMARTGDGRLALVELKAVDGTYPMLGELTLDPKMPVADLLAERDGAFGAAADATLLARLDLKIGDRVSVGSATFQIRSVVGAEPDKLAGGVGFGPRFLVSEAGLARDRTAAARQPGALDLSGKTAGQRGRRSRRADARQRRANRAAGSRAGKSAPAATPRRSLSAPSAALPSSSRWSASPRCWSAASASPTPSKAISIAAATSSRRSRRSAPPAATSSRSI